MITRLTYHAMACQLDSNSFQWDWTFIGLSLAAMLVARALSTFPLCALANLWRTQRIPWRYMVVLWFAGLRGSIAFALALNVRTQRDDHASVIRASTLVAVLLTTVVRAVPPCRLLFTALCLVTHNWEVV
jgi:NhaP-type Na+/H+ or K+/H+ antiporter